MECRPPRSLDLSGSSVGVGAVLESGALFGADEEWDVGVRIFSGVDTTEQGLRLGARVVFGRALF
jgi:hypothetical protein